MSEAGIHADLPKDWTFEPLRDLGTWTGGGTPSKQRSEYWEKGIIPWVSPKDMKQSVLDGTADMITAAALEGSAAKRFEADSIAMVVRSGILEHTLPIALVPFRAAANQDMRVLTPRNDLDPRWVLHALMAHAEVVRRTCSKQGTTVASIEVPRLMDYKIPVPPRPRQKEIVDEIEVMFEQLKMGRQQLQDAVGQIVEFRKLGLADILRGTHSALSGKHKGLLANSERVPLDEASTIQYGWTAKATNEADGCKMLRITDIQNGAVDWGAVPYCQIPDEKLSRYLLNPGDLVFARSGATTGKSYLVESGVPKAVFASYLIRVRSAERLRSEFLALFFQSAEYWSYVKSHSRGMAQPNLNGSLLAKLEVPVPDIAVQDAALEVAKSHLAEVRSIDASLRQALDQAAILVRGIYQAVFTIRPQNG